MIYSGRKKNINLNPCELSIKTFIFTYLTLFSYTFHYIMQLLVTLEVRSENYFF